MSKDALKRAFIAGWFGNNKARMQAYGTPAMDPIERAFDGWYREQVAQASGLDPEIEDADREAVAAIERTRRDTLRFDFDKLPRPDPLRPGYYYTPHPDQTSPMTVERERFEDNETERNAEIDYRGYSAIDEDNEDIQSLMDRDRE